MKRLLQLGMLLASMTVIPAFAGPEQQEVDRYIAIFQGNDTTLQVDVCNELQWAGISDTRLFDVIESQLLGLMPGANDAKVADRVAWYAKALGTSGQEKYLGTLNKMASGELAPAKAQPKMLKKLIKYGQEGIDMIPNYKKWNPIISDSKNFNADKPLRMNKFANMLKSDELQLQLIATKRMNYELITDGYLLGALNERILQNYPMIGKAADKKRLDAVEWMIRTLAALGAPKYQETMQEVLTKTSNRELASFAKKTIKKYY